jgi:tetratricopeptide (TPR) repeat protein
MWNRDSATHQQAELQRGNLARDAKDWAAACAAYASYLKQVPTDAPIHVQHGHALKESGQLEDALTAYRTATRLKPSDADAWLHFSHLLARLGHRQEALGAFARTWVLGIRDTNLVAALIDAGGHEMAVVRQAIATQGRELSLDPELLASQLESFFPDGSVSTAHGENSGQGAAGADLSRANRARDARQWSEAAQDYERYLKLNPHDAPIYVQYGHALKEAGQLAAAISAYREAARLSPTDFDPWLHLAHLLRRTGPREDSLRAFARTWLLGHRNADLVEAMKNTAGYRLNEVRNAFESECRDSGIDLQDFAADLDRIAPAAKEFAAPTWRRGTRRPLLYLSTIDWFYRRQRPQHLASAMAAAGYDVYFFSTVFERIVGGAPRCFVARQLAEGVQEVLLQVDVAGSNALHKDLTQREWDAARIALADFLARLGSRPIVLVDHPAWLPILEAAGDRAVIVYDCIDNVSAFPKTPGSLMAAEQQLIATADVVVASSLVLAGMIEPRRRVCLIPNAADTGRFSPVASADPPESTNLLYFGKIAEWFNWQWIDHVARARPDWTIHLVGEVTTASVDPLRALGNVQFAGEVPYDRLAGYLAGASAAIIPFRLNDLTHAVNPVKVYEYLSAGRPVVASAMRELESFEWVRCAVSANEFEAALASEVASDTPALRSARSRWAAAHDWKDRAQALASAIESAASAQQRGKSGSSSPEFSAATADTPRQGAVQAIASAVEDLVRGNPGKAAVPAVDRITTQHSDLPFPDFVLFVAPFPQTGAVVEGWMARIRAVDEIFAETPRIYLHFSTAADAYSPPQRANHSPYACEFLVNPASVLHAELVEQAMAACRFCYVHTVHLAKYVAGYFPTGKLVTDFHGIVPEEEAMLGNPEAGRFYEGIECTIVHCSRYIAVVTNSMADHLRRKYPFANFEAIVLPIIVDYEPPSTNTTKPAADHVDVIYSGGSQIWQNIDIMIDIIGQSNVDAKFRVASHDWQSIKAKAELRGIADDITYGVHTRAELPDIYAEADFGFVLRDDSPVNRVACPTKLTEYIQFGIIPIVKLAEIGDFAAEGYEYITAEEFAAGLIPGATQRSRMIERNKTVLARLRAQFVRSAQWLKDCRLASRIPCGELRGLPMSNELGLLPWKREVYVFGSSMTYVKSEFLRPYTSAEFILPDATEGGIIRLVPCAGDCVVEFEEVAISTSSCEAVEPVLVQSRARATEAGDCFSAHAPFVEIKLSQAVEVQRVEVRLRSMRPAPHVWHLLPSSTGREITSKLRIVIHSGAGTSSHESRQSYVA